MSTNASVIVEKKARRARPRNKDGTFGQSEAQLRRKAMGTDPASKAAQIKPGIATTIADALPTVPSHVREQAAQAVATISANAQTLTKAVIDKLSQSIRRSEGLRIILDGGPRAARYAMALVDGEYPEAPHAVRLQAAFGIMEMAGYRSDTAQDDRDLSELSLDELNQKVLQMEHKLDVATSIPGESVEVGNAALLTPNPGETIESGTQAKRQAIE